MKRKKCKMTVISPMYNSKLRATEAKTKAQNRIITRRKIILVAAFSVATLLLSIVLISSVQRFSNQQTIYVVEVTQPSKLYFPDVSICSDNSYNLKKLIGLGLDINCIWFDCLENIRLLKGLDQNITQNELEKKAIYSLGELVSSVTIGDMKIEYDASVKIAKGWQLTYDLLRPCWKYSPPPVSDANAVMTIHTNKVSIGIDQCSWTDDTGQTVNYSSGGDCVAVQEHCNITYCGFEQIKATQSVIHLQAFVHRTINGMTYDMKTFPDPMSAEGQKLSVEQYRVSALMRKSTPYRAEIDCVQHCLSRRYPNLRGCHPMTSYSLGMALNNICLNLDVSEAMKETNCRTTCQSYKDPLYWRVSKEKSTVNNAIVTVSLDNKYGVKVMRETEVFPLSKLIADFGGNLGLFIGISICSAIISLLEFLLKKHRRLKCPRNSALIFKLVFGVIIFLFTITHLCISIREYLEESELPVLRFGTCEENCEQLTPAVWAAIWMVTRSIGCRIQAISKQEECVSNCSLNFLLTTSPHLPQLFLEDEPKCLESPGFGETFSIDFNYHALITSETLHSECSSSCSFAGMTQTKSKRDSFPMLSTRIQTSATALLCTLGGIFSLYSGASIWGTYSLLQLTHCSKYFARRLPQTSRSIATLIFKTITVFVTVIVSLQQLTIFYIRRPIVSSSSVTDVKLDHVPVLTVCPFIRKPFVESNIDIENFESFDRFLFKGFECGLFPRLLKEPIPLEVQVENIGEVRCATCRLNITSDIIQKAKRKNVCGIFDMKNANHDISVDLFAAVHVGNDRPVINGIVDVNRSSDKSYDFLLYETHGLSFYEGNPDKKDDHQTCYQNCLTEQMDMGAGTKFDFIHLKNFGNSFEDFNSTISSHTRNKCSFRCRDRKFSYLDITKLGGSASNLQKRGGVRILQRNLTENNRVKICSDMKFHAVEYHSQTDMYTASQLVSDLGGITGFVLGLSLYGFFQIIVRLLASSQGISLQRNSKGKIITPES